MAFRLGDLLVTVVHPDISALGPPPPIPPAAAHRPTWLDDLRAVLTHATAQLEVQGGATLAPPQTLVEATALEQHLAAALREVREVKDRLAAESEPSAGGPTDATS